MAHCEAGATDAGVFRLSGQGLNLPDTLGTLKLDKKKYKSSKTKNWHPDWWVFDSKDFVNGVSDGVFGEASSLARWLEYEKQGLMETGYKRNSATPMFKMHQLELIK